MKPNQTKLCLENGRDEHTAQRQTDRHKQKPNDQTTKHKQTNERTNEQTNKQTNKQTNIQIQPETDGDGWTNEQTNEQRRLHGRRTNKQTNKQTNNRLVIDQSRVEIDRCTKDSTRFIHSTSHNRHPQPTAHSHPPTHFLSTRV